MYENYAQRLTRENKAAAIRARDARGDAGAIARRLTMRAVLPERLAAQRFADG